MGTFILKYRGYLLSFVLFLVLIFSFIWYLDKKESEAYQKGFDSANTAWIKKGQEYVSLIEKNRVANTFLNDELNTLLEEKRKQQEANKVIVKDKQVEYNKTAPARSKGLDDNFIDIYNGSLGE